MLHFRIKGPYQTRKATFPVYESLPSQERYVSGPGSLCQARNVTFLACSVPTKPETLRFWLEGSLPNQELYVSGLREPAKPGTLRFWLGGSLLAKPGTLRFWFGGSLPNQKLDVSGLKGPAKPGTQRFRFERARQARNVRFLAWRVAACTFCRAFEVRHAPSYPA